jgi:hypothetical protein
MIHTKLSSIPLSFKMQVSVGTKKNLGKALSLRHGYSLTKVNNAA